VKWVGGDDSVVLELGNLRWKKVRNLTVTLRLRQKTEPVWDESAGSTAKEGKTNRIGGIGVCFKRNL